MSRHKIYSERGVQLDVYVQKEAKDYLDRIAQREGTSMSIAINTLLMKLRQKELDTTLNKTDSTYLIEYIVGELVQNIKEKTINSLTGVKNE
jgi:glutamyl-tRNA reductase